MLVEPVKNIVNQLKILNENMIKLNATLKTQRSELTASWVLDENGDLKCTRCEKPRVTSVKVNGLSIYELGPTLKEHVPYCPKCGAKMI